MRLWELAGAGKVRSNQVLGKDSCSSMHCMPRSHVMDRRIHQPCTSGCSRMARQRACAGRKEQRRRVILSLRLSRLVEGLTSSALVQGVALPACVTSLEDHGYLLSFGIQVSLCASCVDTRQGKARQGKARQGKAKARQGKARGLHQCSQAG